MLFDVARMNALLMIIATAVTTVIAAHGFGDADSNSDRELIEIAVIGAVQRSGTVRIPEGTNLETVLNVAGCHRGSYLRRIRVTRFSSGSETQYLVAPSTEKDVDVQVFALRNRDIVYVPDNLFDSNDKERPILVMGPFILRRNVEADKEAQQDGTGQPATRPESKPEGSDKPQPEAERRSR